MWIGHIGEDLGSELVGIFIESSSITLLVLTSIGPGFSDKKMSG